jgi:hypothetical protein
VVIMMSLQFFFSVVQQPKSGLDCPVVEASRSHTIRHIHTLFWTSDQLVAEAATYLTHNKHKRGTSMP